MSIVGGGWWKVAVDRYEKVCKMCKHPATMTLIKISIVGGLVEGGWLAFVNDHLVKCYDV